MIVIGVEGSCDCIMKMFYSSPIHSRSPCNRQTQRSTNQRDADSRYADFSLNTGNDSHDQCFGRNERDPSTARDMKSEREEKLRRMQENAQQLHAERQERVQRLQEKEVNERESHEQPGRPSYMKDVSQMMYGVKRSDNVIGSSMSQVSFTRAHSPNHYSLTWHYRGHCMIESDGKCAQISLHEILESYFALNKFL